MGIADVLTGCSQKRFALASCIIPHFKDITLLMQTFLTLRNPNESHYFFFVQSNLAILNLIIKKFPVTNCQFFSSWIWCYLSREQFVDNYSNRAFYYSTPWFQTPNACSDQWLIHPCNSMLRLDATTNKRYDGKLFKFQKI